jgi:hypothetical protein
MIELGRVRVELTAEVVRTQTAGPRTWTLRYSLARVRSGGAVAFAIHLHGACQTPSGTVEEARVAGLQGDAGDVARLFHSIAEARVLPVHLADVVADAARSWAGEELAPVGVTPASPQYS